MKHKGKFILTAALLIVGALFGILRLKKAEEPILLGEETARTAEVGLAETESGGLDEEVRSVDQISQQTPEPAAEIFVHVCGEVRAPGVYALPAGSRAFEAVEAAQGFTDEAAEDYLNLAYILTDGLKVYIPSKEEVAEAKEGGKVPALGEEALLTQDAPQESEPGDGLVNLNTASKEELLTLPGIGEAKASAILAYREANGSFSSAEEIMNVEGIKEGMYSKLKDRITVR